jgi:uracil-DNA glycosylase
MPDIHKPLEQLRAEWGGCMRCTLGEKREETYGQMAFGEGRTGGIMFIGEGPGGVEAQYGRPFVGPSGTVLRKAINRLGLAECSYISNIVACRSFGPRYDSQGQMMMRWDRKLQMKLPLVQDESPPNAAVNTCLARLYEEIYLVDPLLIVALGGEAAKALTRRAVKVTEKRGTTCEVRIPGAWTIPDKTSAGNWARRVRGEVSFPTKQNYVDYLMITVLHPSFVLRNKADQSYGNPTQVFIEDMHFITDTYYRYIYEAFGINSVRRTYLVPNDIIEEAA